MFVQLYFIALHEEAIRLVFYPPPVGEGEF